MALGSLPVLVLIITTTIPLLLNLNSTIDIRPLQIRNGEKFDFIVVGAGTAGCALAARLSEVSDFRVLLLEPGGEEPFIADIPAFIPLNWNTAIDWQYKTQPDGYACGGKSCEWNSGKVMGGTSILNGMIYNRGNPRSYDEWNVTGWSFDELLPVFKKSENNGDRSIASDKKYHSVGGPQNIQRFPYMDRNVVPLVDAFEELGYKEVDINAEHQTGVMRAQFFQKNGARMSTNTAYLKPVRKERKNLVIQTNARVTKVIINADSKKAIGVEVAWEKLKFMKIKVYAEKEIILCAGAIKSPHLLMLSGIGPESMITSAGINFIADLPVGQNLQDHVTAGGLMLKLGKKQQIIENDLQVAGDLVNYFTARKGPLANVGSLAVTAYINSRYADPAEDYPDIQYFLPPMMFVENAQGETNRPSTFSNYNRIQFQPGVLKPKSRGNITVKSNNPFIQPIIYTNYFQQEEDVNVFIDGCKFVIEKMANTKTLKNLGISLDTIPQPNCKHLKFGTDEYCICLARNYTQTLHHFSGTCKMGNDGDKTAVVNQDLRVIGIGNLRVADVSIMPLVGNANTAAPALMIAEKAAEIIKKAWGQQ